MSSVGTAGPALVVVLRGFDAFRRLETVLQTSSQNSGKSPRSLEHVMSATPEVAFRLAALFFNDDELFADNEARPLLPDLPPVMLSNAAANDASRPNSSQPRRWFDCSLFFLNRLHIFCVMWICVV